MILNQSKLVKVLSQYPGGISFKNRTVSLFNRSQKTTILSIEFFEDFLNGELVPHKIERCCEICHLTEEELYTTEFFSRKRTEKLGGYGSTRCPQCRSLEYYEHMH